MQISEKRLLPLFGQTGGAQAVLRDIACLHEPQRDMLSA